MTSKAKTLAVLGTLVLHGATAHAQIANKKIMDDFGWMAPAIATFHGRVYYAFLGLDNKIKLTSSSDGVNFSQAVTFPDGTLNSPALATFGNRLFVAWGGANYRLQLKATSDGTNFSDPVTLPESSYQAPAIAAKDSRLSIAWTGTDKRLNVASSADGIQFSKLPAFSYTSKATPALATSSDGKLFLAWADTNGRLYTAYSFNGVGFTTGKPLNETAYPTTGPSLKYVLDYSRPFTPLYRLYIMWTGTDCQLNTRYSPDGTGTDFPDYTKTMLGEWNFYGPVLGQALNGTGIPDGAYIAWIGTDYHPNIARLQ